MYGILNQNRTQALPSFDLLIYIYKVSSGNCHLKYYISQSVIWQDFGWSIDEVLFIWLYVDALDFDSPREWNICIEIN